MINPRFYKEKEAKRNETKPKEIKINKTRPVRVYARIYIIYSQVIRFLKFGIDRLKGMRLL